MKVRVISYDSYEDWYEEKFKEGNGKDISELTDEEFMEIYNGAGEKWEFSLEGFAREFNIDGPYAPTPSYHIIHFFPNE